METTIALVTSTALALIQSIAPLINDASAVGKIIVALETYLPVVEQFATDLVEPFKNAIAALQSGGSVTDDQIASLKALDAQADAAFDAALAAYNAANPPPSAA